MPSGTDGPDTLDGGPATGVQTSISGGPGDDLITNVGFGDGGAGNDTITGAYSPPFGNAGARGAQLLGGLGNDSLVGTDSADYFSGGAGNNTIVGGGGVDSAGNGDLIDVLGDSDLDGGYSRYLISETGTHNQLFIRLPNIHSTVNLTTGLAQVDIISGGVVRRLADLTFDHINWVSASGLTNSIMGSAGGDYFYVVGGENTVFGGAGGDTIVGGGDGHSQVNGNTGNDAISWSAPNGSAWLLGGQGDDAIGGNGGANIINGNLGNDSINGGLGPEHSTLRGGQGDDHISSGSAGNLIFGDLGNNEIYGSIAGSDTIHAGAGHDSVIGWHAGDLIQVDAGVTCTFTEVDWTGPQVDIGVRIKFSNGGQMDLHNTRLDSLQAGWIVSS